MACPKSISISRITYDKCYDGNKVDQLVFDSKFCAFKWGKHDAMIYLSDAITLRVLNHLPDSMPLSYWNTKKVLNISFAWNSYLWYT